MDNQQTWVEALNINPENLNEWSSQAPPGKPLLVWCIEQGHVSAGEYFLWASERYALPVLSGAFFEANTLDPQFIENQRNVGQWSAWCFPVDQWDGITYVACVEPPEERPAGVCFVLADPRAMLEAWESSGLAAAAPAVGESEAPPPLDAPVGINLETKAFKLNLDDLLGQPNTTAPTPKPPQEDSVVSQIGSEKTAMTTAGILKLDLGGTKTMVNPDLAPPAAEPTRTSIQVEATKTMIKPDLVPPIPGKPAAKAAAQPPAAPKAPPPAPPKAAEMPKITLNVPNTPVSPVAEVLEDEDSMPDAPPDLSARTVLTRFANPVEKLDLPQNEQAALQKAFAHINKVYKHSCVLRVSDTTAKFYKADNTMKADPARAQLSLDQPSCLRIVLKTGLPYHGYLIDTPLHRDFFKALGDETLPDCVTAVPLKVNGRIWGVLMAVGTENLQNLETLGMVEGTAVQLMTALGPTWARAS